MSSAATATAAAPAEREWSPLQDAIFAHRAEPGNERKNLVVEALAGTGKSTTIEELVMRIPASREVGVFAFNKPIAEAMKARINDPSIDVATWHSFALRALRAYDPGIKIDTKQALILVSRAGLSNRREKAFVLKLLGLAKGALSEPDELEELADLYELWAPRGSDSRRLFALTRSLLKQQLQRGRRSIDFDDMIWLAVQWGIELPQYADVVVDEAQDLNPAQLELALRTSASGRLTAVGDRHQCHPGSTLVLTPQGERSIRDLRPGDSIVGWDQRSQQLLSNRVVREVASRTYSGQILTVRTSEGRAVETTPNHRFVARWADRTVDTCVTYLMWRAGFGFRVGWCQLFNAAGTLHLGHRARIEKADKVWILRAHKSRTEASVYESIVAAMYGIPTITYEPVSGAQHLTRAAINAVFASVPTKERGELCLQCHGRTFEDQLYPYPDRTGQAIGRRTLFRATASNLMPGLMSLPSSYEQAAWTVIDSIDSRVEDSIEVFSLSVSHSETYVASGVVVHNSIYQFRGADSQAIPRIIAASEADLLPLSITYRCARSIVREANRYVPELQARPGAPEGIVRSSDEDEMFEFAQPGDFVLSRLNAPLVKLAYQWLRAGVACEIRGRNIGADLMQFIESLGARSIAELELKARQWEERVTDDESRTDRARAAASDRVECVVALARECSSVGEMVEKLEEMFGEAEGDPSKLITLSSTHKAKGLEAERCWLLRDTYRPGESQEETNLLYVAQTRAKSELIYVSAEQ